MSRPALAQRPTAEARGDAAAADLIASPVPFLQRSGLGPAAFADNVNAVIGSGGQALSPAVRGDMESRFGTDFGHVRVHDDARAHDSARSAEAAAYTVGEHVVFGSGRYAPDTDGGRALLAHELAHTVQQGGVQFQRLDGRSLVEHAGLEREADRAADAALRGAAPEPLTRLSLPTLARAAEGFAEEKGGNALKSLGLANTPGVEAASKDAVGADVALSVVIGEPLPLKKKGSNTWVNELWQARATADQLIFETRLDKGRMPALKETVTHDEYRGVWLKKYGYTSLKKLGEAIGEAMQQKGHPFTATSPPPKTVLDAFAKDTLGGSNIDHIIEKQVGGTSTPENMQIINASDNQAAGRELNQHIVGVAERVLKAADPKSNTYDFVRLRFRKVKVEKSSTPDFFDNIEAQLRASKGALAVGPAKGGAAPKGTKTTLVSGVAQAVIYVDTTSKKATPIADDPDNALARRLVPGLDLREYLPSGSKQKPDTVTADVDSERYAKAIQKAKVKGAGSELTLTATAGEGDTRVLALSDKSKQYDFFFPYLSPGKFTKLGVASDGSLEAEGHITPSLKFLKQLDVKLSKDTFELKSDLGPENLRPPFPGLTFTEASISLKLAPEFRPSGTLAFVVGPTAKPYATGSLKAGLDGSDIVLDGDLLAKNIPGVDAATGKVRFHQTNGWSGELKATTSKLPRTKTAEVIFGFATKGGATAFYADGRIQFDVGTGKDLTLTAKWRNERLVYGGELLWEKPIKLVDQVALRFTYDGETLDGTGETAIRYKKFDGRLKVHYAKKGDAEAKLSGSGTVDVRTEKADGSLALNVSPEGVISGKGTLAYQLSDKLKPTIGVVLHPDGHLTLIGKIEITKPVELFPKFPKTGGERDLIKVNIDFIIPGPFPGLADPMVHLGAGVRFTYGIGPGQIVNTIIEGSFDPLEENKNAKLKFTSTFEVPAHVGLTGILEAGLGIAVLGGLAAKVHGGLRIEPGFQLQVVSRAPITAEYDQGDFSFEGRLEMQGGLVLGLAVKLYAHVEAIGGALEKDFNHELKNYKFDAGAPMTLTLAKIGYSTKTGFKAPSLDDIKIQPNSLDPIEMVRKIGQSAKAALASQG